MKPIDSKLSDAISIECDIFFSQAKKSTTTTRSAILFQCNKREKNCHMFNIPNIDCT